MAPDVTDSTDLVELAELAQVRAARAALDERELGLVDRARYRGATWAQIADALGLTSRQAAQQRQQRLRASARARRRDLDLGYAAPIAEVRAAIVELVRWIDADRRWDSRFVRAALVRETAAAALDAPPGPLHALASHLAADLADADQARLPRPVRDAAARLATGLSTKY